MTNYLKEIEKRLGNYKRLPDVPFYSDCNYAVFPALDDNFIDKNLYEALFEANKKIGNNDIIFRAFMDVKGNPPSVIHQKEMNWHEFEVFQESDLVFEGFYITGENMNWLGIYHPDDYVVIGANNELTLFVSKKLYGERSWKSEFDKAFYSGRLEMYKEDYDLLKIKLFADK